MSKMSQLAMELDELAVEKGFQDYREAHAHGYTFTTDDKGQIILALTYAGELEAAHNAMLKERDEIIADLKKLVTRNEYDRRTKIRAIEFLITEVK